MATATKSDYNILLKKLAKPYETITVRSDVGGGYIFELITHVLVHRVHTDKTAFKPRSFYNASWLSNYPVSMEFIKELLKKFREAREVGLAKGEYRDEILVGGEYQGITRRYNQWFYWNPVKREVVGKIHDA